MRYFLVCVTFPLCRYVASVNQALETKLKDMKKHGEQNVKYKFTQTCATEREDLTRLKERRYHFYTMSGFMSTCISILSTWTGRAKKLDEVQFSILSRMKTENGTQLWAMTRQAKHAEGGIDGTATNYEKLGRMYQKDIHIATDPAFQQSNQMLDAKLEDMT